MSFGRDAAGRKRAARQHARYEHKCKCGRVIRGNAYYSHRAKCQRKPAAEPQDRMLRPCRACGTDHLVDDPCPEPPKETP